MASLTGLFSEVTGNGMRERGNDMQHSPTGRTQTWAAVARHTT